MGYDLIQNGDTCDHLPTTLGLKISDLFPDSAWEAVNIPDHEIPFNSRTYLTRLMMAMSATSQDRFVSFIKQKEEEEEEEEEDVGRARG
ncbi:hypothetical protein V1506DRAFT_533354 [Lipomyces tetrasporus]